MKKLFPLLVLNIVISYSYAQEDYMSSSYLDSIIQYKMDSAHIPGLSSSIVKDGDIVWIGNYGYAYMDLNIEVDTGTLFMLASISKTFIRPAK